jgi:hypothetical protein
MKYLSLIILTISAFFLASFVKPDQSFSQNLKNADSAIAVVDSFARNLFDVPASLSDSAFKLAISGYKELLAKGTLENPKYLSIADFSQSSRAKRLYVIDMIAKKIVMNTFVSHGKNSGFDMATKFSNSPESEESSLGFFKTKQPYVGKHGLSLRMAGLEEGINDNAEARAIVVHGAAYVNDARVNSGYMGRSQGCPAVPQQESAKLVNTIKNGSLLFIYSPSQDYVQHSSILNS